jgi:hypothetical protein
MTVGDKVYRIGDKEMQDFRMSLDMLLNDHDVRGR